MPEEPDIARAGTDRAQPSVTPPAMPRDGSSGVDETFHIPNCFVSVL
ncbi:hypothetical protein RAA17_16220 [Komagataeibacter rhaeticus]|nr:hypothetical protein [Komagataeibacter rhaeticus]